jgi:dTDP-glucose 4,6-dehydratase
MRILVTGGCGFIGSALIEHLIEHTDYKVINLDALTYAANPEALSAFEKNPRYTFIKGDIKDSKLLDSIFKKYLPHFVMHLAAESHVDRSIESSMPFVETNVLGTVNLLTSALDYWKNLPQNQKELFRFHHISTDEVYGTLGDVGLFSEKTAYDPRSPYSASKASSDHFVSAFHHTYGLPVVITNCSNNYGPNQFPEKLIPLTILKCLNNEPIPVYGKGNNIRDWLFVKDHVKGLMCALENGFVGEKYNIGGDAEKQNLDVVKTICKLMDNKNPRENSRYEDLITFVQDRPGHDLRYAIDHNKITTSLGWKSSVSFEEGLSLTIDWYLSNQEWLKRVKETSYSGQRIGLK